MMNASSVITRCTAVREGDSPYFRLHFFDKLGVVVAVSAKLFSRGEARTVEKAFEK